MAYDTDKGIVQTEHVVELSCFLLPQTAGIFEVRIIITVPLDSPIFNGLDPHQNGQEGERVDAFVNQVYNIDRDKGR